MIYPCKLQCEYTRINGQIWVIHNTCHIDQIHKWASSRVKKNWHIRGERQSKICVPYPYRLISSIMYGYHVLFTNLLLHAAFIYINIYIYNIWQVCQYLNSKRKTNNYWKQFIKVIILFLKIFIAIIWIENIYFSRNLQQEKTFLHIISWAWVWLPTMLTVLKMLRTW